MRGIMFISLLGGLDGLIGEACERFPQFEIKAAALRGEGETEKALSEFKNAEISEVLCVPVFVYGGRVYDKACGEIKTYGRGLSLTALPPLISSAADFKKVSEILNAEKNAVFCIHKTEIDFKSFAPGSLLWETGDNVKALSAKIRGGGFNEVNLLPLMMNFGYHFKYDVLGVLKTELEGEKIKVSVSGRGLLEYADIRKMILGRIAQFYKDGE